MRWIVGLGTSPASLDTIGGLPVLVVMPSCVVYHLVGVEIHERPRPVPKQDRAKVALGERSLATRTRLYDQLAGAVRDAPDPVLRVREVCRHLFAIGAPYYEAGDYLLEASTVVVRHGAAGELVRQLELVPPERRRARSRSPGRTLARSIHFESARLEIDRLRARTATATATAMSSWCCAAGSCRSPTSPVPRDLRLRAARPRRGPGRAPAVRRPERARRLPAPRAVGPRVDRAALARRRPPPRGPGAARRRPAPAEERASPARAVTSPAPSATIRWPGVAERA
jgi:hypothetical protein